MRVIGAGLVVFLAVTAILLYQVSSGGNETAAIAVVTSPEPTATATLPSPSPTPTTQPTRALPTATMRTALPTATTVPVEPTSELVEPTVAAEEPEAANTEILQDDAVDDLATTDDTDDPVSSDDNGNSTHLAGVNTSDAWSGAIETPNGGMIGTVLSGLANVRALPTVDAEVVDVLYAGWPVAIYGATVGDLVAGTDVWYQVSGGYVSADLIAPFVPATPEITYAGNWIDIDLTRNVAVAYVDDVPVNAVPIISGKPGFETPVGVFEVFSRVESDTLDSATVGIYEGDPEYYYLPDVPYVQYFAAGGFALHGNYWSDPWQFGMAGSHGCINLLDEDAAWFWWFLDIGSVVNIHY